MNQPIRRGAAHALLLVCLGAAPVCTGAAEQGPVRAELLADSVRLEAGRPLGLVARLEIEPGWHVYWKNPGDAGLATEVELELPAGASARALAWPTPALFEEPGGITAFGYANELTLGFELTPDLSLVQSGPTRVGALISWLACKERCVLGEAQVGLDLPVEPELAARGAQLIEDLRRCQPTTHLDGLLSRRTVLGGVEPGARGGTVSIWLQWRTAPDSVELFPDPGDALKVEDVLVRTRGNLSRLDATVRHRGAHRPSSLETVVVVVNGDQRVGYRLSVPLDLNGPDQEVDPGPG